MKKLGIAMSFALLAILGSLQPAEAGQYDLKKMTPEVERAIANRQNRYDALQSLKMKGDVGENNRGYVEMLGGGADVKVLVKAENADRKVIYQAIIEQNELGAGALAAVEGVFAGVQRDKATVGEKVQDAAGNWITK